MTLGHPPVHLISPCEQLNNLWRDQKAPVTGHSTRVPALRCHQVNLLLHLLCMTHLILPVLVRASHLPLQVSALGPEESIRWGICTICDAVPIVGPGGSR